MAQKAMNRWQKVYCDMYYDGKAPRDAQGKRDVKMLGAIKSKVKVDFPDFKGVNGIIPAHTEVFEVTENESNMPKGKISVEVLVSNINLWQSRGYKIYTE